MGLQSLQRGWHGGSIFGMSEQDSDYGGADSGARLSHQVGQQYLRAAYLPGLIGRLARQVANA